MKRSLKPFVWALQFIFVVSLIHFTFRLVTYHFALVAFPFTDGLREGAMMTSTNALLKGLNPYDMSLQPQFMNQYGIVYPLFVWPWAKLFGLTILVHRIVTAFFIIASCVLIYFVNFRKNVPLLLNFWAVLMLYSSLLYPGTSTPTIDPGATGMFFFLLTIFIPWFCNYSYKSLLISILCGIIAFYTKAYVFIGVFMMLSYLFLFVSKWKGLIYGLLLMILMSISIVVVNQILPAYFDNCFFTSANMAPAWSSMVRLHEQVLTYSHLHQWTLILMGVFLLWSGFKYIRINWWDNIRKRMAQLSSVLNFFKLNEPLIKLNFPLIAYAGLCSSFVLYISLGRHSGALLWYFFQLLSPFLLIGAVWLFRHQTYWPIFCIPFLILNLHTMTIDQKHRIFDKKMPGWAEITEVISQYQHILNSPLISPIMIEQNKDIVDAGQAEYFGSGGQRNYWMKGLFKEDDRVSYQLELYFANIREKVENKEYDLIIIQPSLMPMGIGDDIQKYYKFEGQFMLYAPQDRRSYALTFWKPL